MLNSNSVAQGAVTVEDVSPGVFAANSDGQGVAAAIAVRAASDGSQVAVPLLQLNSTTNQYEAVPLSVSDSSQPLYLLVFGTGFRNASSLDNVTVTIGGVDAEVSFAGAQGSFVGLDQANVLIPSSLAGRGDVDVIMTVDGKISNTVTINVE